MRIWVLHIARLVLLSAFLISCNEEEGASYPPVKLEFLTAEAGADGTLQTLVTDKGERLVVAEDRTRTELFPNGSSRVVGNYEVISSAGGQKEVRIYALANTVSPAPVPAAEFGNGLKLDPVDVLSIWMGRDFLNMTLSIKAQSEKHRFHFIEESVVRDAVTGRLTVRLMLYHDNGGDMEAYTKRAYVSVPLGRYAASVAEPAMIYFSLHTYDGKVKTYQFEYVPSH